MGGCSTAGLKRLSAVTPRGDFPWAGKRGAFCRLVSLGNFSTSGGRPALYFPHFFREKNGESTKGQKKLFARAGSLVYPRPSWFRLVRFCERTALDFIGPVRVQTKIKRQDFGFLQEAVHFSYFGLCFLKLWIVRFSLGTAVGATVVRCLLSICRAAASPTARVGAFY